MVQMRYKYDKKDQIKSNFIISNSFDKLIEINKNEADIRKFIYDKSFY